jgi:transposase
MFLRQKKNKSGSISIQIVDKSREKYHVLETIGCASDSQTVSSLLEEGERRIKAHTRQGILNFEVQREEEFVNVFMSGLEGLRLVGPELVLGKIFDEIFSKVSTPLFRTLVLTRLSYPGSKLKTVDYLNRVKGETLDVDKIYRFMDIYHKRQMEAVQQASYQHTLSVLGGSIKVVFYDVTTLYFESEEPDELRKTGFSKDGKHSNPQIVLGLLVSVDGYPLAFDIFEGDKYEGHTLLSVVNGFKDKYKLTELTVVADAGLLSKQNIIDLNRNSYKFILGGRLKNESEAIKERIYKMEFKNGDIKELENVGENRIIISYSDKRAAKDLWNRERGIEKLRKRVKSGKLTKDNINKRGYNKYLKLEGEVTITINQEKFDADNKWDGLKGYVTNTSLTKEEVIEQYQNLWKIERAFRISKTDLKVRPIFHRLKRRIEAHISIAFCAYKVYKEVERQLVVGKFGKSVEQVIDTLNSIYELTMITPYSKTKVQKILAKSPEQQKVLDFFKIFF